MIRIRPASHPTLHTFVPSVTSAALAVLMLTACAGQPASDSGPATTQDLVTIDGLGSLSFPNSGNDLAQEAFHRGVLLLHSFEFEASATAFEEATAADPEFALAYWGHAMTFNHPLWKQKDREAALSILTQLGATAEERRTKAPTERERLYLDAIEALFAEGPKPEADRAYMEAMKRLLDAHPNDHEARAFYALAILGSADGERDFATYMRAGATAQPVFDANPEHPGGAHYLIHSYDDPVHAPLGLPAALRYADIAPSAAHAQHMTTHIFLALGMWDEVVTGNIRARDTQDADREALGRGPNLCGHYSSWLQYGHLQRGEVEDAAKLMDACHEGLTDESSASTWAYFAGMRSRQIVDTEGWELRDRWLAEFPGKNDSAAWQRARFNYDLSNAVAALRVGEMGPAGVLLKEQSDAKDQDQKFQLDQLRGLVALARGQEDLGLLALKEAAERAESLPFGFGPPGEVKPAFELLGEELLRLGQLEEAEAAFRTALSRTPGRKLTVRGLEQARGITY